MDSLRNADFISEYQKFNYEIKRILLSHMDSSLLLQMRIACIGNWVRKDAQGKLLI